MSDPETASSSSQEVERSWCTRLHRLRILSALIHRADSLESALDHALQAVTEVAGVERAVIALVDDVQDVLVGRRALGLPPGSLEGFRVALDQMVQGTNNVVATALQAGKPVFVGSDDGELAPALSACYAQMPCVVVAPLVGHAGLLGTLSGGWSRDPPADARLDQQCQQLMILADQVAVAIDTHLRLDTERRERRVAEELHTMAQRITAGLSLDDVLAAVVRAVETLLGATSTSIFLASHGDLVVDRRFTTRNTGEPHWDDHTTVRPDGLTINVLRTGLPIVVEDSETDPRVPFSGQPRHRTFVVMPMRREERTVGVLYVNWRERRKPHQNDLRLIETLAEYGAIAIENARKHAGDVETARLEGVLLAARTLAHEINSALTLTMGMAEIAQMQAHAGQSPDPAILDDVMLGAQRIARQVGQLQNVVRIEERHMSDLPPLLDLSHSSE
jgi:GAF domain-containing protein